MPTKIPVQFKRGTAAAASVNTSVPLDGQMILVRASDGRYEPKFGNGTDQIKNLGSILVRPKVADISDAGTTGRDVLKAATPAAARTTLGAGTSNLAIGTTAGTAKVGSYQPTASNISDSTVVGRAVLTATDAPAARSAIGATSLVVGTAAGTAAEGNDSRLSDTRTPSDGSVTDAKVAAGAGINLDKTGDSANRFAMTANQKAIVDPAVYASSAVASAALTVGTSAADVTGMTLTVPVVATGDRYLVTVVLAVTTLTASGGDLTGQLLIGGTAQSAKLVLNRPVTGHKDMIAQTYVITGLTAGNVIFKVQALAGTASVYQVQATNSVLTVARIR